MSTPPTPSRTVIDPRTGGTVDVLALQRTAGNGAVVALLNDVRPTRSAVLARMTVTAPLSGGGVFTTVSVSSRAATGYARGQGSHTTAWVTFVDMIKLRVTGQTPAQAAQNLVDLYNELVTRLPGAQIQNQNALYWQGEANTATQAALANPNKATIETAIAKLLKMRNAMPLTRTDYGSRAGGNESFHVYMMEMERMARSAGNQANHRYYANRYDIFWELFDFQPTTGVENDTITDTILQHIYSMQATYEELFVQGDLTISDVADHFVNTPGYWNRFVQNMTTTTTAYPNIAQKQADLQAEILSW